jgi:HK97 family phage prohead protease
MARVGGEEIDLTPTDGMAKEAQKALDWRKDGFDGGTAVGLARARQLINKQELSPSTVRRMHSFFSRHEVDKQGEGFSPGEPGFPSNGRVAWALWGGDPGQTWARAKSATLDRLENKTIDYTKEYMDEDDEVQYRAAMPFKTGDYVKWNSSGGTARGRIEHVMTEGTLGIPDSSFSIEATKEDPAALIRIYRDGAETDTLVGHKFSTLTKITAEEATKTLEDKSMKKIFKLDSAIKAIEEVEGELRIAGYASTDSMDRSCDKILATAWTKGGLRNFEMNPILLFNHNYDKPIGKVVEMGTDSRGLKIKGVISKSAGDVYNLVKEGVLSTFSVGFLIKDADYDKSVDGLVVKSAELLEVSVVSIPCNQDATFSVAKSFDSQDDYQNFKKQFDNALGGQPPAETGGSSEGAKASRKLKMDENTQDFITKAIADALAANQKVEEQKAAKIASEKAAAEALEQKVAVATAKILSTSEERITAELEKRFKDESTSLTEKLDGLRTELAEKAAEITAMTNSKRVFSDRGSNSAEWKKSFAREMDDAYLLARVTGKGYNTDFAKQLIEKVNTHSSVSVSSADFEQEVSTNIERDIENELILAPMFREISMNSASMIVPIMPDSGYAEITSASGSTDATAANGTIDSRGGTNRGGIALTEVELRTVKMIAKSYLGNETEEDAIMPILPLLRESMIRQHARGVENMLLLGNLNVAGSAYPSLSGADGLLKYASSQSRDVNTGTAGTIPALTAAGLLSLRKNMGKYGLRASDIGYIVSQRAYFELLEDPEFQDFNLVNQVATKLTGEVGQVFGSPVMVCDEFPAAAAGSYYALAVNTRNFVVPRLRGVTVESDYLVEEQHRVLVTSQRLGFKEIIPNAKSVIGFKYPAAT